MHKALKEMHKQLKAVDLVMEVRDARVPFSAANPEFETLLANKRRMLVMNKSDLASRQEQQVGVVARSTWVSQISSALGPHNRGRVSSLAIKHRLAPFSYGVVPTGRSSTRLSKEISCRRKSFGILREDSSGCASPARKT
jgi:hypothetical protein